MLEFIQLLLQRYQTVVAHIKSNDPRCIEFRQRIEQLQIVESYMRKGQLINDNRPIPLQIAVIGPTQVGKSSVTNALLQQPLAGVSPLAGYTTHSFGFCNGCHQNDCLHLQNYFARFQQIALNEQTFERYDCYVLTENDPASDLLPNAVLWDTPDFDSIDSEDYREGLIRTIALADVLIWVLSKEKYADQSVWDMMAMLEPLHQTTLICLNKLPEGSEAIIRSSLEQKWRAVRSDPLPMIVSLLYQSDKAGLKWPQALTQLTKIRADSYLDHQQAFINCYWHQWVAPVVEENEAYDIWLKLVTQSIESAIDDYKRDYLNHPHYYDTFQNALVELLKLLEIPGVSHILTKGRRVLTWPIRKLMGTKRYDRNLINNESVLLQQIGEHLIISVSEQLLAKIDSDSRLTSWWKECYCLLRQDKVLILEEFQNAIHEYRRTFQQDVEATASRLYHKLSEQPVLLNSLRATRVTTDAAAMALVIQTGGIGVHDLVITPAMLSLTSMLTESAIGSYMGHVEAELKNHQLDTVKQQLFVAVLQKKLDQIPHQLSDKTRFNLTREQLESAEQYRHEKKHGIRFL